MDTCKLNVRPFLIVQSSHKSYDTDRGVQLKNSLCILSSWQFYNTNHLESTLNLTVEQSSKYSVQRYTESSYFDHILPQFIAFCSIHLVSHWANQLWDSANPYAEAKVSAAFSRITFCNFFSHQWNYTGNLKSPKDSCYLLCAFIT